MVKFSKQDGALRALIIRAVEAREMANSGGHSAPQWGSYCLVSLRPWAVWDYNELTEDGQLNPARVRFDADTEAYWSSVSAAARAEEARAEELMAKATAMGWRGGWPAAARAGFVRAAVYGA